MKRGKEIKFRNNYSSYCKVLKYAGQEVYDVWDWNQERQPMNRHIERREVPGEGNIVMEEAHSRPTSAPSEPRRSVRARTSTWDIVYKDFESH